MSILQRLQKLEALVSGKRADLTAFKLADGSTFFTELDPLTYILIHGAHTPCGDIVGYENTVRNPDAISAAIDELILSSIGR